MDNETIGDEVNVGGASVETNDVNKNNVAVTKDKPNKRVNTRIVLIVVFVLLGVAYMLKDTQPHDPGAKLALDMINAGTPCGAYLNTDPRFQDVGISRFVDMRNDSGSYVCGGVCEAGACSVEYACNKGSCIPHECVCM